MELPALAMSKVRHERAIFVNRDPRNQPQPQQNIQMSLEAKVGGFLGMGKTWSRSQITLDKDIYQVGETIRVKIHCDNSECSKDVEGFKLKLLRNV